MSTFFVSRLLHKFLQFMLLFLSLCRLIAAAKSKLDSESFRVDMKHWGLKEESFAGLIPLDGGGDSGSYFFWLFEKRGTNKVKKESEKPVPLIIWLNGGPGCSSSLGMMYENGPSKLAKAKEEKDKYEFTDNPWGWNEEGHMLYVEQPLRTGFSRPATSSQQKVTNELQIAEDFYSFLMPFYRTFPNLLDSPLILAGESYAGMYLPNIAQLLVQRNFASTNPAYSDYDQDQKDSEHNVYVPIYGIAIGNGAIDPIQDLSHAQYAFAHGLIPYGAKIAIEAVVEQCEGQRDREESVGTRLVSDQASADVVELDKVSACDQTMMDHVLLAAGQPNEYNTATFIGYDSLLAPHTIVPTFFNDREVQRLLHVVSEGEDAVPWATCNDSIESDMSHDWPISSVPALQFLADHIHVLLYSGENDLNCNFLGTMMVLEEHTWRGVPWKEASRGLYRGPFINNSEEVAGQYYTIDDSEKFSFLVIRNAGHLVPMDSPEVALDMIRRFIGGESFMDTPLPAEQYYYIEYEDLKSKSHKKEMHGVEHLQGFLHTTAVTDESNTGVNAFGSDVTTVEEEDLRVPGNAAEEAKENGLTSIKWFLMVLFFCLGYRYYHRRRFDANSGEDTAWEKGTVGYQRVLAQSDL
eukprot:GSChrysophyteH1.ASY1.ANO1.504.1 assembled CDS